MQEVASSLRALTVATGLRISPMKILQSFKVSSGFDHVSICPLKWKLSPYTLYAHHKEEQCLLELFGFGRQNISQMGVLFWPIFSVTYKAVCFEWSLEQERAPLA